MRNLIIAVLAVMIAAMPIHSQEAAGAPPLSASPGSWQACCTESALRICLRMLPSP